MNSRSNQCRFLLKLLFPIPLLVFWMAVSPLHAGPDEEFSRIVESIQEGDRLLAEGRDQQARVLYTEAEKGLKQFQKIYEDWDSEVVASRLSHVTEKLAPFRVDEQEVASRQELLNRIMRLEASNRQYQNQLDQLHGENTRLNGKLREALAIRPSAKDPSEYRKVLERMEDLSLENDQLASRNTELEAQLEKIPSLEAAQNNLKLLEETRENLNNTLKDVETLRKSNESLRSELDRVSNRGPSSPEEADGSSALVASLQQEIRVLQARLDKLTAELNHASQSNQVLQLQLASERNNASSNRPQSGGLNTVDEARLALSNQNHDRARQLLEIEAASQPANPEIRYLLGLAYLGMGRNTEAEQQFKKAIDLSPDLAVVHQELAKVYADSDFGTLSLARWHYNRAVSLGYPRNQLLEEKIGWK